ncbi:MAG: AAA family ATPase [Candidatus Margulisbacteria bacterium]|nr:AAA family ATPase [Candidatus Margulisiibacteriota bacterium]
MFLKSLSLRGFKTFADATEIEFSENARITAVVGPNGCGKSNLMDATRWVLAEDNPRKLRVASLSNIIFAGTAARKSLSLAEVALTFDNSTNKFPLPFSEVEVKRRTFREGESEFFINKNQCRLKDIKDLLLDTGLGESSYSIITQGQVDAILSSKGEDRRAVFEEAAGINKYKTRKIAAEKKIIAAEQNILRISDLKIEVGEQIITLEEQARQARQYLQIQEELKTLDLGLCRRLLEQIFEKRTKLTAELEKAKQASEVQKASEEKDSQLLADLRAKQRQLEQEIDQILVSLEQEKDQMRDLELDHRFIKSEIEREEKEITSLSEKEQTIQDKINGAKATLEQQKKGLELTGLPLATSFEEIISLAANLIEQLSFLVDSLGKENQISLSLGHSAEKEEAYKVRLEMLEEEATRLAEEKERTRFALQASRSQLENLTGKTEDTKKSQSASQLLAAKRTAKEEIVKQITALEEKIKQEGQAERKTLNDENALAIALAKLEGEMNGISEKVSLEYNMNIEEALAFPHQISNVVKSKKDVEEKKLRLRQLEPVNLLAIEEFDKAKERLTFLEAQLADLNAARDNLRNLIIELDQKAEQTFLETMQQISTVFSEVFAKLFAGGEAKITLSEGVAALEAEIEISVRPNGRKWLPLPLLSGGERSLSAIAILFSLLRIRPSPFCFLDEVDAALDDANLGRFAEMLKDFSNQSQIIVITHNKRTMAVADNIYGVTMEEPGISKVISMKMTESVK